MMTLKHRECLQKWQPWTALMALLWVPALGQAASLPGGARSVKVIFKPANFSSPSSATSGTNTALGDASGGAVWATKFYPTSSSTSTTITRPEWLSGVSVTLGGSLNSGSPRSACGGFASSGGSNSSQCDFDLTAGTRQFNCNGPDLYYRVSEYDCANIAGAGANAATAGTGASTDPVAIKIFLNRDSSKLGPTENLMLVLEYQASGIKTSPESAQNCILAGEPNLADPKCVDQSYSLYSRALNENDVSKIQKIQTLIPPQGGKVNASDDSFGGPIQTRQIIIPLSSLSSEQTVLQVSRTFGLPGTSSSTNHYTQFSGHCVTNSPLCVGLVLYSISIFRI